MKSSEPEYNTSIFKVADIYIYIYLFVCVCVSSWRNWAYSHASARYSLEYQKRLKLIKTQDR